MAAFLMFVVILLVYKYNINRLVSIFFPNSKDVMAAL